MGLTLVGELSVPAPGACSPHRYRALGARVALVDESGRLLFVSPEEHRRLLKGLGTEDPLRRRLADLGWGRPGEPSPWAGPPRHVLALEQGGSVMTLETAGRAVEFALSVPGACVLELTAEQPRKAWAALHYAVELAQKKARWARRALSLEWRSTRPLGAGAERFLEERGVGRRLELRAEGAPLKARAAFKSSRALLRVPLGAQRPREWIDRLRALGVESLRLEPEPGAEPGFGAFHADCLDRMIELGSPRDELLLSLLDAAPWALAGSDLLGELAYAPDGGIYTSEGAWRAGQRQFRLGALGRLRYSALPKHPATSACLVAGMPENQPQCFQCAYSAFCALSPSANHRLQGTIWGQTPSSPLCAARMAALDRALARLDDDGSAEWLERWRRRPD